MTTATTNKFVDQLVRQLKENKPFKSATEQEDFFNKVYYHCHQNWNTSSEQIKLLMISAWCFDYFTPEQRGKIVLPLRSWSIDDLIPDSD